jgi:CRP-like cAMP-binding protein
MPGTRATRPSLERPRNQILASLSAADFKRLRPQLTTIPIRARQVLYTHGEPIRYVYFPNGGVVSITLTLSNGRPVEVATVGDEGMLGLQALFSDGAIASGDALIQVPDTNAEMMRVEDFRRELTRGGGLRDQVGRYGEVFLTQMMQTTACNAVHPVSHRCARWLLMTHDRMHRQDFTLSHEFLAAMLAVQRPTVSEVAGKLQKAGFIRYRHGRVTVQHRKGLEEASCECYASIRAQFARLS